MRPYLKNNQWEGGGREGGNVLCMPVIPALRRLKLEDLEFKASLGYTVRFCLKTKTKNVCHFKMGIEGVIQNKTNYTTILLFF
jgi:hypothetical protein